MLAKTCSHEAVLCCTAELGTLFFFRVLQYRRYLIVESRRRIFLGYQELAGRYCFLAALAFLEPAT